MNWPEINQIGYDAIESANPGNVNDWSVDVLKVGLLIQLIEEMKDTRREIVEEIRNMTSEVCTQIARFGSPK